MEEKIVIRRGKGKIQNVLNLSQIYLYYIKDLNKESKYYVDSKLFRAVFEDYTKILMKMIIEDGFHYKVPYRLGNIRIRKKLQRLDNLKPDYGLYHKSDYKIKNKFLNEHTGGYYVRFYWDKARNSPIKNKTAYCFIPTRHNKRYLASLLKDPDNMFQINKYFE